jgi:hypothetical protein
VFAAPLCILSTPREVHTDLVWSCSDMSKLPCKALLRISTIHQSSTWLSVTGLYSGHVEVDNSPNNILFADTLVKLNSLSREREKGREMSRKNK